MKTSSISVVHLHTSHDTHLVLRAFFFEAIGRLKNHAVVKDDAEMAGGTC